MNQSDENPTTAPDPIAEVSEAEAKPVRRRRTTKAEAPVTEAEAPVADVPDADPALKAAPKPARRRKAPAKEAEVESGAESVEAAPVAEIPAAPAEAVVEAAPRAPRAPRSRAKPAAAVAGASDTEASVPAAPSQVDVEVPAAAVATMTPVASSEEGPQGTGAEGVSVEGEGEGAGAQVDSPRSSRNRRRGRKDRVRGEGAEMNEGGGNAVPRTGERQVPPPVVAEAGAVFAQVLSGDFDVEDAAPDAASEAEVEPDAEIVGEEVPGAPKRVLQADPEAPKLHKVLAQAGVGSRRDMEELILDGQITVNGEPAHIGQRISFGDRIQVKGKPVRVRIVPPPPRIIAYHKPVGEVVTHDDPEHRPTVFRRLPRLQQGKWQSVGRLDLNTEGLLLFTNSGELANQLMHPRFGVEREYAVRVLGTLERDAKARLLEGVMVEGQTASFKSIEDGGGEGANHWYRVVITEGRNREVRKLFDTVGLTVSRLIRIRYGSVVLPRGLKRGVWVDLDEADVRIIRQLTGLGEGRRDRQEGRGNNERGNNNNRNDRGGRQGAPSQPNERGNNNNSNNAHRGQDRNNERGDRGPRGKRGQGAGQGGQNPQNFVPAQARERTQDEIDRDEDLDFDPSKIPNPLEQTFDKRFVQKPRGPAGGAGFGRGGGGFGAGGSAPPRGPGGQKKGGGPREPDPLQTSMGYLGADAFHGRGKGGGGGNRGGGNRSGGGGFGGGGGGGGGFGGGGGRRGR